MHGNEKHSEYEGCEKSMNTTVRGAMLRAPAGPCSASADTSSFSNLTSLVEKQFHGLGGMVVGGQSGVRVFR